MSYHFDWSVLLQYRGLLLEGLIATIELAGATILLSTLLGLVVALARLFGYRPVRWATAGYTELFRNVPPLVQFFFWNFAVGLDVFPAALVGLSVFTSAYVAETVRAGVQSIPPTQMETARCAGMTALQAIVHIILPQGLMRSLPALSVEFINVIKNSAVAMTIGYTELTFQTQQIEAESFRGFEAATAVTLLYVMLSAFIVLMMHGLERVARLDLRRG